MGPRPSPVISVSSARQVSVRPRARERDRGFTLIELLVVVIVIGLLAAIAIPVFLNQRKKGSDATLKADLKSAATAIESWNADNPTDRDGPAAAGTPMSNYAVGSDVLASSISLSDGSTIKTSPGNFMEVYANSAGQGFCVAAASTGGTNAWVRPGRPGASEVRVYDSTAGGITATPSAGCAFVGAAAAPAGWAASTNAVQCPQVTSAYLLKRAGASSWTLYTTITASSVDAGATVRASYGAGPSYFGGLNTMTPQPADIYMANTITTIDAPGTYSWMMTSKVGTVWSTGCTQGVQMTTTQPNAVPLGTRIDATLVTLPPSTSGNMFS